MVTGWMRAAALAVLLGLAGCGGGPAPQVQGQGAESVVVEDFLIAAKDDGIRLSLINKHPAEYFTPRPERTVLFLHGATFPGQSSFDLKLDGTSWMDWLARRGYDVYALDLRGYGRSTRPESMASPPDTAPPAVDGEAALRDVAKAVEFILSRRNLPRLSLVGWSWGATLAGRYTTTAASGRVERLVLLAPQWLRDGPAAELGSLGAWRPVRLDQLPARWLRDVPEAKRASLVPASWQAAWIEALKASDPEGARQDPPVLRVANGAVADTLKTWAAGIPAWEPAKVGIPTLVIQGEWDVDSPPAMGVGVFAALAQAPQRRYVLLGEATHMVMMERNRDQLFRAVQGFLEERF